MGKLKAAGWLADQEQRYRTVLYVADSPVNSPWTQTCIRQVSPSGFLLGFPKCFYYVGGLYNGRWYGRRPVYRRVRAVIAFNENDRSQGARSFASRSICHAGIYEGVAEGIFNPRSNRICLLTAEKPESTVGSSAYTCGASGTQSHMKES